MKRNLFSATFVAVLAAIALTSSVCDPVEIRTDQETTISIPIVSGKSVTVKTSLVCSEDLLELVVPKIQYIANGEVKPTFTPMGEDWNTSCDFYASSVNDIAMRYLNHKETVNSSSEVPAFAMHVVFAIDENKSIDANKTYRFVYGLHAQATQSANTEVVGKDDVTVSLKGIENVRNYLRTLSTDQPLSVNVTIEQGNMRITTD
ncbi:MAG: hypothetical protein IKR25_00175 [Muribaculaceae bacterium]|nr:hypothetical protein [Muribaculaceae bacterium]